MIKTTSEICIEVDGAESIKDLSTVWDYVRHHARQYPLVDLRFMSEHVHDRAVLLNERKGQKHRPYGGQE